MKTTTTGCILSVFMALGLLLPSAHGVLISNWTQYSGSISSDLNTSSPILGNGTTESADNQTLYANLGSVYTLSGAGDSLTFSGSITLANLNNPQADQLRFGLYDSNGQAGATGWLGYFFSNTGASAGPTYSRLWERSDPNTGSFGSGTGAVNIANANATPGNTSFATGSYDFALTLQRDVSGYIQISWSLEGTSLSYSLSGSFLDTTPLTYDFDRVGLFAGGGLNADQASFSNLSITQVPEPGVVPSLLLGVLFLGALRLFQKHQGRKLREGRSVESALGA